MTSLDALGRGGRAALCALVVPILLLAGCSGSVTVGGGPDMAELEEKLVEEQEKKSPDLAVGEATCPEEVDVEETETFECTVEIEGVEAPYEVTLTKDPDGESGEFHFEAAKPIIDVSIVEDFIRSRLNEQSAGAEVSCGDAAVLVTEVGATFDCTVSDDERGSETVVMVVKNIEDDVGFQ